MNKTAMKWENERKLKDSNEYQSFAMLCDEILGRFGPRGQFYIINSLFTALKKTQIKPVLIH